MAGTVGAAEAADKKGTVDVADLVCLGLGGHIGHSGPWTWSSAWGYGTVCCSHIETNNTSFF